MQVLKHGKVKIEETILLEEWNEDLGWEETAILPGLYEFQILDFRGWKPHQLKIDGVWVDVGFSDYAVNQIRKEI